MTGPRNIGGFSLLEVLLAGFILFSVLATTTLVYRGALITSGKAETTLEMVSAASSIKRIVREEFRAGILVGITTGRGEFGELSYLWTATVVFEGRPEPLMQEEDFLGADFRYLLWHINFEVYRGDIRRSYHFREISW
jgi:hypothetical protein